jgi:hypothetical protein
MDDEIRMPLLMKLAEQAMSDQAFRRVARVSLEDALAQFGYALNEKERALVMHFRQTLEEAGVDLFLTKELDLSSIDPTLLDSLMNDVKTD